MTMQRLEQQRVATFTSSPQHITFTFPPVPQGLTWTGSIAFSVALGLGPDLQGIIWTAYRNGLPFLTWQEYGVASDVQATSGEVISVVGVYVGSAATIPQYEIHCTWTGYSDDAYNVLPAVPWVSGSDRGLVQVYNSNGADAPLAVVLAPQGTETEKSETSAGGTALVLGTPSAGHPWRLWELTMQLTAASLAAETGAKWLTGTISEDTSGKVLMQAQISTVPGSAATETVYLPMHGYTLPDGAALILTLSSYTGANANATCSVVYQAT